MDTDMAAERPQELMVPCRRPLSFRYQTMMMARPMGQL